MPAIELTAAERKDKRAHAHHLNPVVAIGAEGLSDAVIKEIDAALDAHGLIKVRVFSDDRAERAGLMAQLADTMGAAPIQHIGKLLVLWRPMPAKQRVERADRMAGPKIVKILKFSKSGNHRPQVKKIRLLGNQRIAAGGAIKRARQRSASPKKTATK
jgi:RNA-binding protein